MRVIHRYWTGPDEPPVDDPVGTIWHDDDLPPVITMWLDDYMDRVCEIDRPRHRSNMVRWCILAEHGGLWLDHDARLHRDPPAGPWVASIGLDACAAAISLPPHHPLAYAMIGHIETRRPSNDTAPEVSGRAPLTRLARAHGVRFESIPGPGQSPTWISHDWATSMTRH